MAFKIQSQALRYIMLAAAAAAGLAILAERKALVV
jgi:hypothetical protein